MVEPSTDTVDSVAANDQTLRLLADQLRREVVTSESLVERSIRLMSDGDSTVFTQQYAEDALACAQNIDRRRSAGEELHLLAGIPISIKDLFDLEGQETWAGSKVLQGASLAKNTAPAIAHLIQAGMVVVGKTNMTEFAYSGLGLNPHFGTPKNPCDPSVHRIPGGSSSGSAVSVANGTVAASIGTDTGGSVRIPSSLCGLTGFKPGSNSISKVGVVPLSRTLDTIGPLAKSVQCCADLFALLSDTPMTSLKATDPRGINLLIPTNCVWDECSAETVAAMESAMECLAQAGVNLIHQEWPLLNTILDSGVQGFIAGFESWQWHQELLSQRVDGYDPRVSMRILTGAQVAATQYQEAIGLLPEFKRQFKDQMSAVDAVLYPTTAQTAPPLSAFEDDDEYSRLNYLMLRNTAFGNVLDAAAISLPVVNTREVNPGVLPVGAMLMRPAGDEAKLLDLAHLIEALLA